MQSATEHLKFYQKAFGLNKNEMYKMVKLERTDFIPNGHFVLLLL